MTASRVLTCLRCGHEGTDVRAKLVDLEDEALAEGGRIRSVEVTQEIQHRHVVERRTTTVPERYGTEWRCRDRVACDQRYAALLAESTGGTHRPVPTPDDPRPRSLAGVDPAAVFPAAPEETEEADPWL